MMLCFIHSQLTLGLKLYKINFQSVGKACIPTQQALPHLRTKSVKRASIPLYQWAMGTELKKIIMRLVLFQALTVDILFLLSS